MKVRKLVAGAFLLAALAVPTAPAKEDSGDKKKVYKTPQEAFAAAQAAIKKEKWKDFANTQTKQGLENVTAMTAMIGVMVKGFAGAPGAKLTDEQKEGLKALDKALSKHGLTETFLTKLKPKEGTEPKKPEEAKKEIKKLIKPIKDRTAFIGDVSTAMKKIVPAGGGFLQGAELQDVKIDDKAATGTVVTKRAGRQQRDPITFKKIGDSWKIEIPLQLGSGGRKAPPPPPSR
jgi:hypothetical protein